MREDQGEKNSYLGFQKKEKCLNACLVSVFKTEKEEVHFMIEKFTFRGEYLEKEEEEEEGKE